MGSGGTEDTGATPIEYFGSPSLELQNAIRISILKQKAEMTSDIGTTLIEYFGSLRYHPY